MRGSHGPKCSLKRFGFLAGICVLKSCVPRLKSWRGWQVNVTLFFLYYSETSSPNRFYTTESYEICILGFRPRLLHMCWPMHDGVQFSHIWGDGKGVSPDKWQLAWKVTFLPVAVCQLYYDALERTVSLKTAISTLPVNMWSYSVLISLWSSSFINYDGLQKKNTLSKGSSIMHYISSI